MMHLLLSKALNCLGAVSISLMQKKAKKQNEVLANRAKFPHRVDREKFLLFKVHFHLCPLINGSPVFILFVRAQPVIGKIFVFLADSDV